MIFFGFWNVHNFSKDGRRELADLSFYSEFCALQGEITGKQFASRFLVRKNHGFYYFDPFSMVFTDENFRKSALNAKLSGLSGSLMKNCPASNFVEEK
jgi:hypothetical protein